MNTPVARLVARALVSGLTAGLVLYQANADAWKGAVVAAVLACLEVLTPLNASVGIGKDQGGNDANVGGGGGLR